MIKEAEEKGRSRLPPDPSVLSPPSLASANTPWTQDALPHESRWEDDDGEGSNATSFCCLRPLLLKEGEKINRYLEAVSERRCDRQAVVAERETATAGVGACMQARVCFSSKR